MNPFEPTSPPAKILPSHLDRWAIVYVRQSHPQQQQRHKESAQVQANLQLYARQWGWPAERIRILDGDQGRSGTSTVGRDDFSWLLSEIALSHVGLVLGFQVNRLAREDEACCRLIKICAAFDTLLADQDGVYHPHDFNDRMLLTLKGFMGGIELHQIQQRMQAGRLNRVRRGEWLGQPPNGFIVGLDNKLQLDPDEEVQMRIRLLLEQFARLGSISALLRHLRRLGLDLPFRPRFGVNAGVLQWRKPTREKLRLLIRHPAYAGAFTWGRHAIDKTRAIEGRRSSGRRESEPENCRVFVPDNHAAYLSWDQYQANRERLRKQRQRGPNPGPQRATKATLAGLVVCGCCGVRMQTRYTKQLRYQCQRRAFDEDALPCPGFAGEPLERLVREQVLQIVTPAGLELCLHAMENRDRDRATLEKQWQLRRERAGQEAERAFRQYNAVEPENRLVARTLERVWEEKLLLQKQLEEEYARFRQTQPLRLSIEEREQIEALATNLPALWNSPQTSVADQRQVVRLLLEKVTAKPSAKTPTIEVQLHWIGGVVSKHEVTRTVGSWTQLADLPELLSRVRQAREQGETSGQIAEALNGEGKRTPRGQPYCASTIRQLLSRTSSKRQRKKQGKQKKRGR